MTRIEELTEEEKQVLLLMSLGRTTKEVAGELGTSPKTVRVSIRSILTKLHVHSRPDPPPLPPAASAALAIPRQRVEDVPTHVGKPLRRGSGPPQHSA
jgi:DNA-binding NarL/FixJ family response regulator